MRTSCILLTLLPSCLATLRASDAGDYGITVIHDRPLIGIFHHTAPIDDLERQGLSPEDGGVSIISVEPDTLASRTGLRSGDVIVSFNGAPIHGSGDIVREVDDHVAGDPVVIGYVRDGQRVSVAGDLGSRPEGTTVTPLATAMAEQSQAESQRSQELRLRDAVRRVEDQVRDLAASRERDAQLERVGWRFRWTLAEDAPSGVRGPSPAVDAAEPPSAPAAPDETPWRLQWPPPG
jgi:membrane-associated protease RseP (regulator of RpoE activity)